MWPCNFFRRKKKKQKKVGVASGTTTIKELRQSYSKKNKPTKVSRHKNSKDYGDADEDFLHNIFDEDCDN